MIGSRMPCDMGLMKPTRMTHARTPFLNRRNAMKLLMAGGTGAMADAFWLEPARCSLTRADMACPNLSPALDGLRVGLLADFHFKPGIDEPLVEQAVGILRREKPDLIVLPGDFIDSDPAVIDPLLGYLQQLDPGHGIFASMGNHDGWNTRSTYLQRRFERAGLPLLINRNSVIRIRGEKFAIAATDHVWLGKPDPSLALRGIPSEVPVLALVHEPDFFDEMSSFRKLLQVSGHTHGGQCRVPGFGLVPAKVRYGRKYIHGAFERGGSRLFVTRGLGTTGMRVRFACPPEVALLTLRA